MINPKNEIMSPIGGVIELGPVNSKNRDFMFDRAREELEQYDLNGKKLDVENITNKKKASIKATDKFLLEQEEPQVGELSIKIYGEVFPLDATKQLKKSEFWWPCRCSNGVDYDTVLSDWILKGWHAAIYNHVFETQAHDAMELSVDSKNYLENKIAEFELRQGKGGDWTPRHYSAAAYLTEAKRIMDEYEVEHEGYIWKALEYSYLAGKNAALAKVQVSGALARAKKGHVFSGGKEKAGKDDLVLWEKVAKPYILDDPNITPAELKKHLKSDTVKRENGGGEEVKVMRRFNTDSGAKYELEGRIPPKKSDDLITEGGYRAAVGRLKKKLART